MASLSHLAAAASIPSRIRALGMGALALLGVAIGLQIMTTQEARFYRTHGMVPDAHTAVRLAELVLATSPACAQAGTPTARLDGEVWTVQANPEAGGCRVQLGRKDGQILQIDARR